MDSIKFVGGATLQKELQGFAGFIAYQECFRKGNSSTKGTVEKSMGELFFGNPPDPDSIGLGEQLIYGNGVFSGLYAKENIENVTTSRDDTASQPSTNQSRNQVSLILKPSLHCLSHEKRVIVGGQSSAGITLSLILANGLKNRARLLSNRTLLCRAQEHVKNGKKALSIVMHAESPYRDHCSTGNLPSGMTLDDYYLFVREGMYKLLHPAVTCAGPSSEEPQVEEANDTSRESVLSVIVMPDSWIFTGFIIFALLGPIVPSNMIPYRSELLMTAPPDNLRENRTMESADNASGTSSTAASMTGAAG